MNGNHISSIGKKFVLQKREAGWVCALPDQSTWQILRNLTGKSFTLTLLPGAEHSTANISDTITYGMLISLPLHQESGIAFLPPDPYLPKVFAGGLVRPQLSPSGKTLGRARDRFYRNWIKMPPRRTLHLQSEMFKRPTEIGTSRF